MRRAPAGWEVEHIQVLEVPGSGFRVSGSGFRLLGFGSRNPGFVFRIRGLQVRISGCECRVSGAGIRVLDFGTKDPGNGFGVLGFGIRSWGVYLLSPMPPYTTSLSPAITWSRVQGSASMRIMKDLNFPPPNHLQAKAIIWP